MNEEIDPQDQVRDELLVRDLIDIRESGCTGCGGMICGHEALMSLTMGFKDTPRCWQCLAAALEQGKEALRNHLASFIASRSCYSAGWVWANLDEGFGPDESPHCLWPTHLMEGAKEQQPLSIARGHKTRVSGAESNFYAEWDAGDMGCGNLVLELRIRMQSLEPGQILKVRATDAGAEVDLPSWCRMTGNILVTSHHPLYLIKRKTT